MQPAKYDREAIRAAWAQQGFTCELWIDPPGQVWHDLQHEVDAVILLLEGEAQIEHQGRTIAMHPGDELQVPAGDRHTVRAVGDRPARWLHGYRQRAAEAAS